MKTYNVIWFDDEYEELEIIKEKAVINGILLKGFADAESGLAEFEKNMRIYDAIIVDGLFINSGTGTIGERALVTVARTLDRIADRKKIPWFILSGQPSFTKDRNKITEWYKDGKVYDKTNDKDLDELWIDLKKEADKQIDTQHRHDHSKVFEACSENYVGGKAGISLLEILKKENIIKAFDDPELYFNPLRKLMEDFFTACNKWGLLPDVFIRGSVSLNEASRFYLGQPEKNYTIIKPGFPGKVVANNIRNVIVILQPASHRGEIDEFVKHVSTPYLLTSTAYQVMDILVWFKKYVDANPNKEKNKTVYELLEEVKPENLITGIIEQDVNRNYHCSDCLLSYSYVQANYQTGDKIRILQWELNNREKTKRLYSKFASKFEKID